MPMPHRTFAQVAKRRLTGKEGRERIREVNALLGELPDYKNGPYADLRKWLDESDGDAAFLGQLAAAAKQWEARGRATGLLWRGEAADEVAPHLVRLGPEHENGDGPLPSLHGRQL